MPPLGDDKPATIAERAEGRLGELALRAQGGHFEIVSNGVFLMDTRGGESERLLARLALGARPGPLSLLIGGLGVGFSLAEALRSDRVERVTVIEIEPKIIAWCRGHLAGHCGNALADPRATVVCDDLIAWLGSAGESFDGVCLDIDNGPAWTVADMNARLYSDDGMALVGARLKPGGVLTVWSAAEAPGFAKTLQRAFDSVEAISVPAPRGGPDVVYVASRS